MCMYLHNYLLKSRYEASEVFEMRSLPLLPRQGRKLCDQFGFYVVLSVCGITPKVIGQFTEI